MPSLLQPHLDELTAPGGRFEVIDEVINGLVQKTYADRSNHLAELINVGLGHGDREFLVQGDLRFSFEATFQRALRLAAGLREVGINPGDRVGVLGSNAPDWVIAFWAVIAADGVVVPFNAWWKAHELGFGLEDSGASFLFCDERRYATALEAGFPADRIAVWGELAGEEQSLDDVMGVEPIALSVMQLRDEDEPAGIFYTSGTTGSPKGSPNSHRNILVNLRNGSAMLAAAGRAAKAAAAAGRPLDSVVKPEQEIDLTVIPLFHATACLTTMIPYLSAGHKLVFMPPGRFDPDVAGWLIEREGATRFGGVPTIVSRILDSGANERHDFSSITRISYGGAPASPALVDRIADAFPNLKNRVINGYGLTECSPLITLNTGPDYLDHPDSVGVPVPTVEISIRDDSGQPVSKGETGEIWVKGSNVIDGYWQRPEINAETFRDGFFRTGDVGRLEEGFLYITDRVKDVVIRGGENIYCVEVENEIEQHPAVVEVAVIGVPHEDLGEEVKAVVVVEKGRAVSGVDLSAFVEGKLASFKLPTHWEIRTEPLPRNPAGKVLKPALRDGHSAVFAVGEESDSAL